jgi:hypothetical protein
MKPISEYILYIVNMLLFSINRFSNRCILFKDLSPQKMSWFYVRMVSVSI